MYKFILIVSFVSLLISCQKKDEQIQSSMDETAHKGIVEEVLQTSSYTYLNVSEDGNKIWLAVTSQKIKTGMVVYYKPGLEMKDFKSKELNRTFNSIFFVSSLSDKPLTNNGSSMMAASMNKKEIEPKTDISIEQPEGSPSIAQLSINRTSFEGKSITIHGQVTKYNSGIMKRNWVHIQDGSTDGKTFDLTVTTNDVVKVGDIVTFTGKLVLNKDFGAGYKYDIILEESTLN